MSLRVKLLQLLCLATCLAGLLLTYPKPALASECCETCYARELHYDDPCPNSWPDFDNPDNGTYENEWCDDIAHAIAACYDRCRNCGGSGHPPQNWCVLVPCRAPYTCIGGYCSL